MHAVNEEYSCKLTEQSLTMFTRRQSKILLAVLAHNGCYFNFVFCEVLSSQFFLAVQFTCSILLGI